MNEIYPDGTFEVLDRCPYCESENIHYYSNGPHKEARCGSCRQFIKNVGQFNDQQKWATEVKQRVNYTCEHCHKRFDPSQVDAHHLIPKWYMPELKYNIYNGLCLCKDCHRQIHGKTGTIKEEGT